MPKIMLAQSIIALFNQTHPPPPPHNGIAPRWGYDFACTSEYNIPMYIELNWLAKTMGRSDCNHMFAHSQTYSGLRSLERALGWIIQLDW